MSRFHLTPALLLSTLLLSAPVVSPGQAVPPASATTQTVAQLIVQGARQEASKATPYIMNYEVISYPKGDVADGTGVCTDLVIRAFRHAGIDLQQKVHEDMKARSSAYPKIWDNKKIDRNIDHRRCPNLVVWLRKNAEELSNEINQENGFSNWHAGDIVFYVRHNATHPWHVAIVSDKHDTDGMPMIIDSFPPHTSEKHRLDDFTPVHSHFRMK